MGNGIRSFLNNQLVRGIGASVALAALVLINPLYAGGQIDCGDPSKDYIELITTPADFQENGVQVVVCIVDGKGLYDIEVIETDDKDPDSKELADTGFEITTYYKHFNITQNGETVTKFDKGIEISIFYTEEALQRIYDQGYRTPRAALLAFEYDEIKGDWEEFGGTLTKEFGPENLPIQGFERVMVFKLWALPDPLIGGC